MEYLAAVLLAAEILYCILCALRLRKTGAVGPLSVGVVVLCGACDLGFLLPRLLAAWLAPERPYLWIGLGELADALLSAAAWLLLYLLWEKRFGGELRDGLSFWTALGGALARVLACAASAAAWLRGESSRVWTLLRLLPLCFLAAAVVAVWRSVRLDRLRQLWPLLIAALALRLLAVPLETVLGPIPLRLPLIIAHAGIFLCLRENP